MIAIEQTRIELALKSNGVFGRLRQSVTIDTDRFCYPPVHSYCVSAIDQVQQFFARGGRTNRHGEQHK
jgi:hypothetical protein